MASYDWVSDPKKYPKAFLTFLLVTAAICVPLQVAYDLSPAGVAQQDKRRQGPDYQAAYADNALKVEEKQITGKYGKRFFLVVSDDSGETWTVEVDKQVYDWLRVGDSFGKGVGDSLTQGGMG